MQVLVVGDDERVARIVERALLEAGHRREVVSNGASGLAQAESGAYDLIVLDVLLPELDGLAICREVRRQRVRTPILMLTARGAVADRVAGLDAGADDYLPKPFALEELLARVRALGRRGAEELDKEQLRVGDLTLDPARNEVRRGNRLVELTPREFELLAYLMRNAGQVLSRNQIASHVWGYEADPEHGRAVHPLPPQQDRPRHCPAPGPYGPEMLTDG